ncbi:MAG: GDP-L-fucose synthase [Xanthomonadales bacterium]|nr:GDP-L-fucose synthase [Xanthomonadales bacterium]
MTELTRVFLAGHRGMVGSALLRALSRRPEVELLTCDRQALDLTDQSAVRDYLAAHRPRKIIIAAARVGGIHANNIFPAEFIYQNLMIAANLIHGAHLAEVSQLLFLGSSCAYPKFADQPIGEEALLAGLLEPTNEPYAVAKIAGIKLCESYNRQYGRDYRSVMPTNLYGPNDNFHPDHSHVVPALIRRFHEAASQGLDEVAVWGSGRALRDFLHVDDLATACIQVLDAPVDRYRELTLPMNSLINIGSGSEVSIAELARTIAGVTGFNGEIVFDASRPDGTPRKQLDVSRMSALGWRPGISLQEGLEATYRWFLDNV